MKNYRIRYRPFATSTVESSDITIPAQSAEEAKLEFHAHYPAFFFIEAKEEF